MEKMNDLHDLFRHEIQDLYSAEEQILDALPKMIEKASHPDLKKALSNHLKVTREHRSRLEQIQADLEPGGSEDQGLLSRLFKSRHTCRGMEGIIAEGEKILRVDMEPEVRDAAIIASAQKVEHYEICSYGTSRTFARELGLEKAASLLERSLNEEYYSDDLLTQLAESRVNKRAELGGNGHPGSQRKQATGRTTARQPEMEMVSAPGKSSRTGSGRGSNAPSAGSAPRKSASTSRTAPQRTRSTSSGTNSRKARGSDSGRSSARRGK